MSCRRCYVMLVLIKIIILCHFFASSKENKEEYSPVAAPMHPFPAPSPFHSCHGGQSSIGSRHPSLGSNQSPARGGDFLQSGIHHCSQQFYPQNAPSFVFLDISSSNCSSDPLTLMPWSPSLASLFVKKILLFALRLASNPRFP